MQFDEFAAGRLAALLRYAVLLTGDGELARDLVQDVLARAFVRWSRITRLDEPYAYVRTMVTNEYLSVLRRRKRAFRTVPLGDESTYPTPRTDPARDAAEREELWQLLGTLPRRQRAVVVLRYYEGLTDREIAEVLGCRPGTVRGHASRALGTLRVELTRNPTDEGVLR